VTEPESRRRLFQLEFRCAIHKIISVSLPVEHTMLKVNCEYAEVSLSPVRHGAGPAKIFNFLTVNVKAK
jgi:hypothetical protein